MNTWNAACSDETVHLSFSHPFQQPASVSERWFGSRRYFLRYKTSFQEIKSGASTWSYSSNRYLKWLSFHNHGPIFPTAWFPCLPGGIRSQLKPSPSPTMTPEMVHPHAFRHRFAKSFIENARYFALRSAWTKSRTTGFTCVVQQRAVCDCQP